MVLGTSTRSRGGCYLRKAKICLEGVERWKGGKGGKRDGKAHSSAINKGSTTGLSEAKSSLMKGFTEWIIKG